MATPVECGWSGERTLRCVLGGDSSLETHRRVLAALAAIRGARIRGLVEAVPAYSTISLTFEPRGLDPAASEASVRDALVAVTDSPGSAGPTPKVDARNIEVCYQGEFAPDLGDVAAHTGLPVAEVVRLHCEAEYTVHFVGFSPGFPYLGGLPAALATPRLDKPRVRVAAGSVGIGGDQTGVYPSATPGGWRIIGRTPARLFDPRRAAPALLSIGDRVRFVPISRAHFEAASEGAI